MSIWLSVLFRTKGFGAHFGAGREMRSSSSSSTAITSPGPAPSSQLFPCLFTWETQMLPSSTCHLCSPALSEHPCARFAAQFPVTPSCQVQYLPLAAPMFSEQGITISLQVSPHFPALTAQLQALELPLPPSATCAEAPQTLFFLTCAPADNFPGGGDGDPPASQPHAVQHA